MTRIELLDFQQEAADRLRETALNYFIEGQDVYGHQPVPFIGQLKAVTGAGKTPILSDVVGQLSPAITLWTTKFGSVVDQTVANLRPGGKYHHLLGKGQVEVIPFGEIPSYAEWRRILDRTDGLTILVSTVAAWNTAIKDNRLNVHQVRSDWGDKSRWDQLRTERKRPLWIVYDEAHNTTTEQIELLDELNPSGFFVASASPVKGKLQLYLTNLPEEQRKQRIVPVSTRAVVDAQLLKSTISLADYDSSAEEMITDVVQRREGLEEKLQASGSSTVPKAIYVVEASNTTIKGQDARPIAIWKTLVDKCGVDPNAIAVCTNTKDLPKDAIRVETIDQLSDQYTHIIFNKKLQEGWDDPSVYVCYFDGKTESATRIQQVLGRALRQPNVTHLSDEDLNTAYFFVNCPNELLEKLTDELKEELSIYNDDNAPDGFEPFKIREERRALPKILLKPEYIGKLKVPRLQLEVPPGDILRKRIMGRTYDFGDDDRAAPGRALVNIVSVRTGDVTQNTRDLLEDMRVKCGVYLQEQIRIESKNCANSLHPSIFSNEKLDRTACYKSKALEHYRQLARNVVREYENRVQLTLFGDPTEADYVVGPYQPSSTVKKEFANAGHPYYDAAAFNDDELRVARAIDKLGHTWVRNKDRVDYGIPLPVKSNSSSTFYPDFLWWVGNTVWAIDPTGKFILEEKIRTKLLDTPLPLRIALITPGKYDTNYRKEPEAGWTLLRRRVGNSAPETFESLEDLFSELLAES